LIWMDEKSNYKYGMLSLKKINILFSSFIF
jgi:hypothetical protein